ncbi:putative peptidylprolyl isomerase [Helianthus debilis subsp. tardiflorus]
MNPNWWNPAPDSGKYTSSGSTPSWWGTPAPDSGKYTSTSLSPSWAESLVSTSSQGNQWALVSNQTPSIQSILLSESETGSLNRPPKLMNLNEYPGWADRFRTYVLGQNTELWIRFTTDFDQAIEIAASSTATFADLPDDQKKTYDLEKKAYAILTQALSKDIYHQFVSFKTTKKLWDGLKTRGVGNEATRQLRHDLLKKEFDGFACLDKESLGDMTSRFYHLLTELNNFGVATTQTEVVKKFADALPPQWNSFLEILKYNGVMATANINDFVQLLENKDQEETLKAKRVPVPQNPEMYYGTTSSSSSRAIVPSSQHAPLQTAFVTSTDMYGNTVQVPVKPPRSKDVYSILSLRAPSLKYAGDLTKNNGFDENIFSQNSGGTVGESIYGGTFPDENLDLIHSGPGILSMSNDGPNKNGSRFLLTFSRQRFLDGCHVVFGKVIKGMEIVQHIDQFGTSTGMPSGLVVITDCGEIPDDITCNVIKFLPFVTPPGLVVNTDGGEDKKSNMTEFLFGLPPVRIVITDGGEDKKRNVIESDNPHSCSVREVASEAKVQEDNYSKEHKLSDDKLEATLKITPEKPSSSSNPHQHSDDLSQFRSGQRSVKKLIAMFSQLQSK